MGKRRKNEGEEDQRSPRTLVKVYNLILTFDTNVANENLANEIDLIIAQVNSLLAKNITDSLPYIFKDSGKECKVSISYNKDED